MTFRQRASWLLWILLAVPILFGINIAFEVQTKTSNDISLFTLASIVVIAAVIFLIVMFCVSGLFSLVMDYFGTPRKGNRVVITDGKHLGKTAFVVTRMGPMYGYRVTVRSIDNEFETTLSTHQFKKSGLWSYLW